MTRSGKRFLRGVFEDYKTTRPQDNKFFQLGVVSVLSHEPENDEENNIVVTNNNIRSI